MDAADTPKYIYATAGPLETENGPWQHDAVSHSYLNRLCSRQALQRPNTSAWSPVAGQQFEYGFDAIGNRRWTKAGGDTNGLNLRSSSYTPDLLNRYLSRTVPGAADIIGSATNQATVAVNNQPASRKGSYFRAELFFDNTNGAVWAGVTNFAALRNGTNADSLASSSGYLFLPRSPESFGYDADGNLTSDGRWTYSWDAENRVTSFTSLESLPAAAKRKIDCTYDERGRRTQKVVSTNNGSGYVAQSTNRFIYDGWNLVAVLDGANSPVLSFTWGTDASGSMQGAGGVGGLLAVKVHSGPNAGTYFYAYDGNYNVVALVNAADGKPAAQYEYGPFGELLRATGPMAKANPFRFSTKYQDDETDLLYYGYRYYNASTGRWTNRDPLGEQGGHNVFAFVRNSPVNGFDKLGQISVFPASHLEYQYPHTCGEFEMDWAISLDSPAPADGHFVQQITVQYTATTCDNRLLSDSFTYWEAFPVIQGEVNMLRGIDHWHYLASPHTRGQLTMRGRVKFFTGALPRFSVV